MFLIILFLVLVLGFSFGSAILCFCDRLENGKRSFFEPSSCDFCGRCIPWKYLIPLWGWIKLGGRCHGCGGCLGLVYPVAELFGGVWGGVFFLQNFNPFAGFAFFIAGAAFFWILVTDIRQGIIPDTAVLMVGLSGWIAEPCICSSIVLGSAMILTRWIFLFWRRIDALGFGDIKLAFAMGIWFPLELVPEFLVLSGILGVISGKIWFWYMGAHRFPFGPAMIFSFLFLYLFRVERFANFGIL